MDGDLCNGLERPRSRTASTPAVPLVLPAVTRFVVVIALLAAVKGRWTALPEWRDELSKRVRSLQDGSAEVHDLDDVEQEAQRLLEG